jgi:hypothetical protein
MHLVALAAGISELLRRLAPDLQFDPVRLVLIRQPVNADAGVGDTLAALEVTDLWITAQSANELMHACTKQNCDWVFHVVTGDC